MARHFASCHFRIAMQLSDQIAAVPIACCTPSTRGKVHMTTDKAHYEDLND
jgi:hypothetical protein